MPEIELVIQPKTQPAGLSSFLHMFFFISEVTTVEGVLDRVRRGLSQDQPRRAENHPEEAAQIDKFIAKLDRMTNLEDKFTIVKVSRFSTVVF